MTDNDRYESLNWLPPWARASQARVHADQLADGVEAYRERHHNRSIRLEHNGQDFSDPLVKVSYIFDIDEPIPPRWTLWLGDAIHNLRSALDHAVWALSERHQGRALTEDEGRSVGFPICQRPSDFASRKGALRFVHPDVEAAVKALQPTDNERITLWWLHELDRINKHRSLHVVFHYAYGLEMKVTPEPKGIKRTLLKTGALEYDAPVASFQWPRPPAPYSMEMDVNPEFTYLEHIEETERTPTLPLGGFIETAVLDVAECIAVLSQFFGWGHFGPPKGSAIGPISCPFYREGIVTGRVASSGGFASRGSHLNQP